MPAMAMTMASCSSAPASLSRHSDSALVATEIHLQPCLTFPKPLLRRAPICRISCVELNKSSKLRRRISVGIQALSLRRDWSLSSAAQEQGTQTVEEELPAKLREIVRLFQAVGEQRARYQQLLYYGQKLKPLAKEFCIPENKVNGCVSQVWVVCKLGEDGRVYFKAESDSALTKGLAALLVDGLSGATPAEVLKVTPDFVQKLGLQQSLTPSRSNGFLNMLKLMQKKTMQSYMESSVQKSDSAASSTATDPEPNQPDALVPGNDTKPREEKVTTVRDSIEKKLSKRLNPVQIEVEDVSHQHAGHAGAPRGSSETHFNVTVISEEFQGLSLVKRHRLIYGLLQEELQNGLHALSLVTKTPAEISGKP